MRSKAAIKANRARNAKRLETTRVINGFTYELSYQSCNGDKSLFDRWARYRQAQLKYDDRFTFVWLSRNSFEFNTSNGTICIVSL